MSDEAEAGRPGQLRVIHDRLADALVLSDALQAHLLSAKIEDCRVCVEEMIDALPR